MGAYQSRLKGILMHLKFQVELAEMELAIKNRKLAEEEEKCRAGKALLAKTNQNLLEKKTEGILPYELELFHRFIYSQEENIEKQRNNVKALLEDYEVCREKLALVLKDKKVVERIDTDRHHTFLDRIEKKDQQAMDEIANRYPGRRK